MSVSAKCPQFAWWQGIIEDRDDPAKLGRYKVRIFGHHPQNKELMPTDHLPWAITMQPVTSAAISGIGTSPTGLVEGSSVVGFFADGEDGQIPVIMGSLGVSSYLPKEEDTGGVIAIDRSKVGFFDPKGVHPHYRYPKRKVTNRQEPEPADGKTHASGRLREEPQYSEDGEDVGENVLEEADSSRLSRGKDKAEEHYSLKAKRESRTEKIPIAYASAISGGAGASGFTHPDPGNGEKLEIRDPKYKPRFWSEPHPQGAEKSATKYPYNHVWETESGHVFEVDDTLGAERIHEFHRTGTFYEIQPKGDKVTKVVGNDFEIDLKNKSIYIKGDYTMTVDGDYYLNIKGNKIEHISGHYLQTVRGSRQSKIQGDDEVDVESGMYHHIGKSRNVQIGIQDPNACSIPANDELRVTGDRNVRVKGQETHITLQQYEQTTFGNHKIQVYPKFTFVGSPDKMPTFSDFIINSKLELMAEQDVQIGTNRIFPDVFTSTPIPAVSITTARYNLNCSADLYEKIGPVSSRTAVGGVAIKPGYATRVADVAINDIQGIDPNILLLPGIQHWVTAGGIINNVLAGGIINNVTLGGIIDNVIAGGIVRNVTAGGIIENVTAGGIVRNVTAGGIWDSVIAGGYVRDVVAGGMGDFVGAGGHAIDVSAGGSLYTVIAGGMTIGVEAGALLVGAVAGSASFGGGALTTLGVISSPTVLTGATISLV